MKNLNTSLHLRQSADFKLLDVAADDSVIYIEGYASVYRTPLGDIQVDRDNEAVNTDNLDLDSYRKNPVLVWNHDWSTVVGKIISVEKDSKGIYVRAEVHKLKGLESKYEAIKKGLVKSFSIGFVPYEAEYMDNDVLEITKATLVEISIAPVQSNPEALFQIVGTKSLGVKAVDMAAQNNLSLVELKGIINNDTTSITKGESMITKDVKEPTVEPVTEPVKEPTVEPVTEPVKEPVTTTATTVVEPVKEPTTEPAKEAITAESLADAILAAELKLNEIKENKAKEDEAARIALEKAEQERLAKEATDALGYITKQQDYITNTPASEIDISAIEDLYEVLADTIEAMDAKILEAITLAKEAQ